MSEKTEKLLSLGLKQGFVGETVMQSVERGVFKMKSSHFENEDGTYHDEWMADRTGGGQEIVETDGVSYTRVYAGGTISINALTEMGISIKDVMSFLKKNILEGGEQTRLFADYLPEPDGDWQYSYTILEDEPKIPLTLGKEVIRYQGVLVFIHDFLITPVE
ncbi:MAG TPA: hypothetical protein PLI45_02375 [Candidatus Woesebacteria bacterium]|nr:hypothetical protein [Candidatus Woesebacteria bacterium]